MIAITNPRFSFVQFDNAEAPTIPVALAGDTKFQLYAECNSYEEANAIMETDILLSVVEVDAVITDEASLAVSLLMDYADPAYEMQVVPIRLSDTKILLYWPHGLPDIETLGEGSCFRLCISLGISPEIQYLISNGFRLIDPEYTAAIEYYCTEDSYGFTYCPGDIVNSIRAPFYLLKPQFNDDESIYFKSNGQARVLKSVTRKVYDAKADFMTEDLHEKLKVALSHDNIMLSSDVYSGGIAKNGPYEIDWPDIVGYSDKAPSNFKVYATPYNVRNDNCATCDPYEACVAVGVPPVELPDAYVGHEYNFSYNLTGTTPIAHTAGAKPAWMTVTLEGRTVTYSGAPTEDAEDVAVQVSFSNCEGTSEAEFEGTLNITTPCDSVVEISSIDQTGDDTATVAFTSEGDPEDYVYILDGGSPVDISSSPILLTGLTAGNHTIKVIPRCSEEEEGVADIEPFEIKEKAHLNWSYTGSTGIGVFRVYVNWVLVLTQPTTESGTITFNVGDVVRVFVGFGGGSHHSTLAVSHSTLGSLYNNTASSRDKLYDFTAVAGTYTSTAVVS